MGSCHQTREKNASDTERQDGSYHECVGEDRLFARTLKASVGESGCRKSDRMSASYQGKKT